jgi:MoxR-like ATPase
MTLAASPSDPNATSSRPSDGAPRELKTSIEKLRGHLATVVFGQPRAIELTLVALLADGHLLIEDVPGIGKTLLAKALARSLDCSFHRIQFTPDLLPSDLLGTSVFHQPTGEFVFKPGPLFAQVILADEINRATPRTQSALLEAMSERQVTLDGRTRRLGPPFLVLATQNPYEFEGTYPLPESQLDRFLLRLHVGYPDRETERRILTAHRQGEPVDTLEPILTAADVLQLQDRVRAVHFDERLQDYLLDLVDATRNHPALYLGASTRAALGLYRAAQAQAVLEERDYVVPDDVKSLAVPVLAHRLLARGFRQGTRTSTADDVMRDIVAQTAVP